MHVRCKGNAAATRDYSTVKAVHSVPNRTLKN